MPGDRLIAPALLAHVFLARGDPGGPAVRERLRPVWEAVTGGFRLDRSVPGLHVPLSPGEVPGGPAGGFTLLAAAESPADAVWQACAWLDHDMLGITAVLAPPRDQDCATTWSN